MDLQNYHQEIEFILSDLPRLERALMATKEEEKRLQLERSLKTRTKRFERLIPYQFRRQLQNLCLHVGVKGEFS